MKKTLQAILYGAIGYSAVVLCVWFAETHFGLNLQSGIFKEVYPIGLPIYMVVIGFILYAWGDIQKLVIKDAY